jgi:hypothetical protein
VTEDHEGVAITLNTIGILHQKRGEHCEALRHFCNTFILEERPMSGKIKIRCNGPDRHVNEIDLEQLLEPTFVTKGPNQAPRLTNLADVEFPLYEDCRNCAGRVIITREIADQASKSRNQ